VYSLFSLRPVAEAATVVADSGAVDIWRVDPVSVLLLVLVVGISAAVLPFAHRSLRGDRRGRTVTIALAVMLLATAVVSVSGALWLFALAWSASTLATIVALAAGGGRPAIVRAAPWLIAADIALWAAVALLALGIDGDAPAVLLVVVAVVRCALPPAHSWLIDSLHAPTPVSAALHGGIVNGGGILIITQTEIVGGSGFALVLLALAAGSAVVLGTLGALVRTDVKGRLVLSTVAQMGFMLLVAALGLTAAALLHLVAHGFYKSSLFLASSDGIDRRAFDRRAPRPLAVSRSAQGLRVALGASVPIIVLVSLALVFYPGGRGAAELLVLLAVAAAFGAAGARLALLVPATARAFAAAAVVGLAAAGYVAITSALTAALQSSAPSGVGSEAVLGVALLTLLTLLVIGGARMIAPEGRLALTLLALGHRLGAVRTSSVRGASSVRPHAEPAIPHDTPHDREPTGVRS
jgi:NAD(P)H-quinone oxidoreductase subunit 5